MNNPRPSRYFVAHSECTAATPCPAALMFHEWNGLTEEFNLLVDRLASEQKLAVIAPDLFGKGKSRRHCVAAAHTPGPWKMI